MNAGAARLLRRGPGAGPFAAPRGSLLRFAAAMQTPDARFTNARRPARTGGAVSVGRAEEVPDGRGATVELEGGKELALFNVGGRFYAVENFCPHRGAPLADGQLSGHAVECLWHGWRFDVRDGACLGRPGDRIEAYEVFVEDGWIKIIV